MAIRTISVDTVISDICSDDLFVTANAKLTVTGSIYGNVEVSNGCHFDLTGIMTGNLEVCGKATACISGSLIADQIIDAGTLTISGNVTSKVGPYHATMLKGAYVNMTAY
ncbi:MAG: hypothetical protein KH009_04680 [Clostridiales bacterium]|nr:hypothetical protein [Clostridiales bacterium]